jgi:predicted dehydrogenase
LATFRATRDLILPESIDVYSDLHSLLGANCCDALIIATPDTLHIAQASAALRAGLHVLVEKPLGGKLVDAQALNALAQAQQRCLRVGYQYRHHPAHALLRARLSDIGPLRQISVQWAWPDPASTGWRARGLQAEFWSISALAVHAIDLLHYFSGEQVCAVNTVWQPPRPAIDQAVALSLRLRSGVLAQISIAVTHRMPSLVRLSGTLGTYELRGTLGGRNGGGSCSLQTPRGAMHEIAFTAKNPYLAQLEAFIELVHKPAQNFADDDAVEPVLAMIRQQLATEVHSANDA